MPDHRQLADYGDAGLLVTFTHTDPEDRWRAARAVQDQLHERREAGVIDVVASFETAFVSFDPLRIDHHGVEELLGDIESPPAPEPGRVFEVPVVYGGQHGPDLAEVAAELGVTPTALMAEHTDRLWTVRLRASPAAAPMTDGGSWRAPIARRPTSRTSVPAGSVALSGQQCMIYPVVSPGGWRLIGQTPAQLFDADRDGLVPYRPGDQLRFVAVDARDWDRLRGRPLTHL